MDQVAAGQLDSLAPLYERHKSPLLGFLVNRTGGDRTTAEDLLHTTFERIIKYRGSWRAGQSFKTWTFTIARNAYRDRCRLESRMPLSDGKELNGLAMEGEADTPTDCRAALAALPENYRVVVELAWQRNMKYVDIARVLGTSEANIKVRMHRACKQLRANYQKASKL
jgi:RNA polymerase sigma-70 factor (ECF subfamily)